MGKINDLTATFQRTNDRVETPAEAPSLREKWRNSFEIQSDDGFSIRPLYDRPKIGADILARGADVPWIVVQRLDDPDIARAKASLTEDLAGGASGIEIVLTGSASFERTGFGLQMIDPPLIDALSREEIRCIRIDGGPTSYANSRTLAKHGTAALFIAYDPLAEASARGGFDAPIDDIEREIVTFTEDFAASGRTGATTVADGRIWAAGGASEAQEITGILGSYLHYSKILIEAGQSPDTAVKMIGIATDAGPNQILTIAKLRALRLVHARMVEAFGLPATPARIHAETAWRMMTRYDPHTNILRTASAAFAAGIGGADSITALPFTTMLGLPDAFARRLARNAQTIFVEESGLARVDDPGAGSGAIEALTGAIARKAWDGFREIEAEGGLLAALRSGTYQRKIEMVRRARSDKLACRQIGITGISEFPNLEPAMTRVLAPRPASANPAPPRCENIPQLVTERLAEPFEALRDRAAAIAKTGTPAKVFLCRLGPYGDFAESAQSPVNFFAAAGLETVELGGTETPAEAADAFEKSGGRVACIVGNDPTLLRLAAPLASALKKVGAAQVCVIGGNASSQDIDFAINKGTNALKILRGVLDTFE